MEVIFPVNMKVVYRSDANRECVSLKEKDYPVLNHQFCFTRIAAESRGIVSKQLCGFWVEIGPVYPLLVALYR